MLERQQALGEVGKGLKGLTEDRVIVGQGITICHGQCHISISCE